MSHTSIARVDALIVSVQNSSAASVLLDAKPPTPVQFEALCAALSVNETVTTLSLMETDLSDAQLKALCDALKTHKAPVSMLNLEYNNLGDQGALALASLLGDHPTIKSVLLAGNHVGDTGADALLLAWKANKRLHKIDLDMNECSPKTV